MKFPMFSRRALQLTVILLATGPWSLLWARAGGGCISGDAKVETPKGPIPIERLKVGDEVWTWDSGQLKLGVVEGIFRHQAKELKGIRTREGTLFLTGEHLVMTRQGGYRKAKTLTPGKTVLVLEEGRVRMSRIREVIEAEEDAPVYNLLVWPGGTFAANSILTHNKGCFLPETPVLRPDGTEVMISQVRPGEELLAFSPEDGLKITRVVQVLKRYAEEHLEITTGTINLRVTPDHPLFVGNGNLRSAGLLAPGQIIWAWDGHQVCPQEIVSVRRIQGPIEVFHLSTDQPHTFFAGGVLAHNKGGGSLGGSRGFRGPTSSSGHSRTSYGDRESLILTVALFAALVIFMIVVSRMAKRSKSQNLDYIYSPSQIAQKAEKTEKLLGFLAKQDPTLAPGELAQRVRSLFEQVQKCWQQRDYGPVKALMAPALYAQHVAQLKSMEKNHEINRIEDLHVERVDLVHLHYTDRDSQRSFTALITARARDYYVNERTGDFLRGDKNPARFQEFWTFRFQDGQWVLSEIEQAGESDILREENFVEAFTQETLKRIYGEKAREGEIGPWISRKQAIKADRTERLLNFLVRTDPLWDKEKMLEKAKQVFIALYVARESGDPEALPHEELFPDLARNLKDSMEQWKREGISLEMRNLCVRKVTLVSVRNFKDSSKDDFTVRIDAHAQRIVRKASKIISQQPYVTPFEEYWTFGRFGTTWRLKEFFRQQRERKWYPRKMWTRRAPQASSNGTTGRKGPSEANSLGRSHRDSSTTSQIYWPFSEDSLFIKTSLITPTATSSSL